MLKRLGPPPAVDLAVVVEDPVEAALGIVDAVFSEGVGPSRYAADSRIKHSISPRATGCNAKDA